jgi:epoxyqueuosine reductase
MGYLETMKDDRYHPENKLPHVQSVIVLQAWYGMDEGGGIARYARGRDYHKVLRKRLVTLSDWLKTQDSGISTYISVDSGPTVDRVLAEVAGLGFFGKNTNLIDPSKGSYFFIASLMTNTKLPLTEKRRMPSCGDCKKCIIACPTGAIVAPRVIDARRCIAYLTIESKEGIPVELRPKIGNRLFGCDICQEVCPFNEGRASKQGIRIDELKAESGVGDNLDLVEILAIETDEQFRKRFAGTSLMRAKRRGLLRNACVVAGNSGDKSLIPVLEGVAEREADEVLKEHASWAIKKLKENT